MIEKVIKINKILNTCISVDQMCWFPFKSEGMKSDKGSGSNKQVTKQKRNTNNFKNDLFQIRQKFLRY